MIFIVLTALLLIASLFPQFWVRHVMRKYHKELPGLPGTGGELAQHLINRFELTTTKLEETTEGGDHYDPTTDTVRLSPSNFNRKSLTAIAVASHEVGHAIQFLRKEPISQLRGKYIPLSIMLRKTGTYLLLALPVVTILLKAPVAIGLFIGLSLLMQLAGVLMYLVVLPEEWDASFNKALPILIEGNYLPDHQLGPIQTVLKAAALTYFASALADILNIGRWLMVLRR